MTCFPALIKLQIVREQKYLAGLFVPGNGSNKLALFGCGHVCVCVSNWMCSTISLSPPAGSVEFNKINSQCALHFLLPTGSWIISVSQSCQLCVCVCVLHQIASLILSLIFIISAFTLLIGTSKVCAQHKHTHTCRKTKRENFIFEL